MTDDMVRCVGPMSLTGSKRVPKKRSKHACCKTK